MVGVEETGPTSTLIEEIEEIGEAVATVAEPEEETVVVTRVNRINKTNVEVRETVEEEVLITSSEKEKEAGEATEVVIAEGALKILISQKAMNKNTRKMLIILKK